jgi:hypothetical protein
MQDEPRTINVQAWSASFSDRLRNCQCANNFGMRVTAVSLWRSYQREVVPELGQWGRSVKKVIEIAEVLVGVPVLVVLIAAGMVVTLFRDTSVG